jgi:hypothetical protein
MQKKSQEKLELAYNRDIVIDIVKFGSSNIKGTAPNDIDIAVIYQKIPVKEQLEHSQDIKKQLEKKFSLPIHMKSYDLYSFFDKGNFARESILFYGKSLISGDYFSKLFGIVPRANIAYSLSSLEKKDKVRFNYLMNGKQGKYGLLREHDGKLIGPGIIEVLPEHESIFTNPMKEITPNIEVRKVFLSLNS